MYYKEEGLFMTGMELLSVVALLEDLPQNRGWSAARSALWSRAGLQESTRSSSLMTMANLRDGRFEG